MKSLLIASLTFSALGTLLATPDQESTEQVMTRSPVMSTTRTTDTVQLEPDPASLSEPERLAWGRKVYRRSCVSCHGIQPEAMVHDNTSRFVASVLEGRGEMPALGFKLNAAEVTVAQAYVAVCSRDYNIC